MNPDRRDLLKILPGAATAALASPTSQANPDAANVTLRFELAGRDRSLPLEKATVHISGSGWEGGAILLLDGAGREYLRAKASSDVSFIVGGALGRHTARLENENRAIVAEADFHVDCSTRIDDEGGVYKALTEAILWTMMSWTGTNTAAFGSPVSTIYHNNRVYEFFANWIFDHTLIMKGMKYYWPNLKDAIDFFANTQRQDGMIWENCYPATPDPNYFDWKFSYDGFVQRIDDGFWQLRRAPVESHVEQYFVEGLYCTWKATGDTDWMKGKLDAAIRALRFVTKSPYRWSEKYQLMHRGFTIDTWDYVSNDQQRWGGSVFAVYPGKSEFGVFHGDNTNLIAQCRNLAEMLKLAGRDEEAPEFEDLADDVEKRLDALAWNGEFYTHWIPENPEYKPDVGVAMHTQVSLSNAYALNRGISHEKSVSIIKTYQRIRREMPASSPGEFYGIYPPFQRDFGLVWEYCNGGVLLVVGGELAHGAFEHGYETYGADILRRIKGVADRYRGYLPTTLRGRGVEPPERTFSTVSIESQANACHGEGGSGVPLWSDDGNAPLGDLPIGRQEFQGVPFDVLDPARKSFRSCIVLSRQSPYPAQISLPLGAKASSIYLLNATRNAAGLLVTFNYADGTSHSQDIEGHSWWDPTDTKYNKAGPRTQDTFRVAWKKSTPDGQEFGVYTSGLNNPHQEREIASIELSANGATTKWLILAVTLCSAPVFFAPYDDLSYGIPDGWNGSVLYALIEGLAGVKDQGVAFSHTSLTPRWQSADVSSAEVTVRYPASMGYCSYKYRAHQDRIEVVFTGSADSFDVQIPLPRDGKTHRIRLDGQETVGTQRKVEESNYVVLTSIPSGVHRIELDLS